jgi:hypothetical protein
MMSDGINLDNLPNGPTRRKAITGLASTFGGMTLSATKAWAATEDKISHTAEAIHQKPIFTASRKRVYEALTETKQFEKVIELSGVMKSMPSGGKPTQISREAGGAFTIFGGHIFRTPNRTRAERANRSSLAGSPIGVRVSTRLRSSSSWSGAPGRRLFLTTPVFQRAWGTPGGRVERALLGAVEKTSRLSHRTAE